MRVLVLIAIASYCSVLSAEYLYPVAASSAQGRAYVVYQKSLSHIELWEWDYHTKQANQLLLSRYSPAGFRLFPDESGFSFIDQGLLKVKQFIKRSPRTIEFDAPISHVELVHWIDAQTCYASGKYLDHNGIFQIDWDGIVQPIRYQKGSNALYPQKIDSSLFYIERTDTGQFRFMQMAYQPVDAKEWQARIKQCTQAHATSLYTFDEPVAFLTMRSHNEGFVIGYPAAVSSRNNKQITFNYYHLTKENGNWQATILFSFTVPTDLLQAKSGMRLYESMLPLLPCIIEDQIYFVDSSDTDHLALYQYDRSSREQTRCISEDHHLFGICQLGKQIWFGGELQGTICLLEGFRIELGLLLKY